MCFILLLKVSIADSTLGSYCLTRWQTPTRPLIKICWMGSKATALFFLKKVQLFIYLFIFGCVGSLFLCEGFLQLRWAGATLHCGAQASHCRGLSRCGAQAPDSQAQWLWLTSLVVSRHVGSSQTRAQTRVPCIGRQILNHGATREAPTALLILTYIQPVVSRI